MSPDDEAIDRPPREAVIGGGIRWLAGWTWRWLLIAAGAVLLGLIVQQLWSILLPLLLGLIVATVLQPPARWLHERAGVPLGLAAGAVVVGSIGLLIGFIVVLAPSVGTQVVEIAANASDGLDKVREWVVGQDRLQVTQEQVDTLITSIQDRLRSSASGIASGLLIGVGAITTAMVNLVITLVLAFFFIKDGRRFLPWLRRLTGERAGPHLTEVASRAWSTLGGFIRTQALVGLIDAVLIGAGLLVVGVPLALPLAALTFVAAFAPIVGAVTVGALAVLVALVSNGWVSALVVLLIVLVVQQLEGNVFLPYLQGKTLRLHAAVVLLAIVLGSTLFGVAGAFLSVPAVAVVAVVIRYLDEQVTALSAPGAVPPTTQDPDEDELEASDAGD